MKFEETEKLELKKSTSELKEAIISIASILNKHQKGEVYFGIKSNGEVIGQDVNEKTLRDISQKISSNIEPKIFPKIQEKKIEGKDCILIEFEGKDVPYFAYGRTYMRVADEDKPLSAKELEKLIISKNKDNLRWDSEICEEAKIQDIDENRLVWFLKLAEKEPTNIKDDLKKLGLLRNNKLTNASIILFGKSPQNYFKNAKLRCAVFGTEDTLVSIDMKEFEGNLFDLIEVGEKYFLQSINIGMKIEGLRRIDLPEINKEAFREAIINAFCHRDYWNSDSVHLAIFRERVEIRSPGLLYGGLTIEKIRKEKISERRNELIAEMFHKVHFVENWGKGISKILGLEPKTEFKELGRKFYVVFKRKTPQKTPQKTTQKDKTGLETKIINIKIIN